MLDDWPFLHLNLLSPTPSSIPNSNHSLDPSLNPLELDRQLEAWSNINFNFDLEPSQEPSYPSHRSSEHDHHHQQQQQQSSFDQVFGISNSTLPYDIPPTPQSDLHSRLVTGQVDHIVPNSSLLLAEAAIPETDFPPGSPPKLVPTSQRPSIPVSTTHQTIEPSLTTDQTAHHNIDQSVLDDDEGNKIALEDDKRRRNTLASARFRMKKKMKEQKIEREAKEMKDRVTELEKEVDTLKQENKWLRGLIVDQAKAVKLSVQPVEPSSETDPTTPTINTSLMIPSKRDLVSEDQPTINKPTRPRTTSKSPNPKNKRSKT